MRIIAGEFRSRKLLAPRGFTTRPMPDRVRESLFAMLGLRVENAHVADLFAGSGAIGLEALSRGAASCVFVEQDRSAAETLEQNIETLHAADRARVVISDALGSSIAARLPKPIDLIVLDPPYPLVRQLAGWNRVRDQATRLAELLAPDGFLILRTPWPFLISAEEPVPTATPAAGSPRPPAPTRERRRPYKKPRSERRRERDLAGESPPNRAARPTTPAHVDPHVDPDLDPELDSDPLDLDTDGVRVSGPASAAPSTFGELTIAGLRGPETHPYGSTAVHWYMRATQ